MIELEKGNYKKED